MAASMSEAAKPIRTAVADEDGIDFALIELLFFAYRDFTSDPDEILAGYGFGRAHHRVLHFVNRRPGLTVAELLDVLKITKQSLARVLKQLIDASYAHDASVLGVQDVPREDTRKYGIVAARPIDDRTARITHIVEKPAPEEAPSTLAVVGRYVLEPEIFDHLRATQIGAGNEIQLTDGIAALLGARPVFAHRYAGQRYDCGSKAGMFQATVALGRKYHGLVA